MVLASDVAAHQDDHALGVLRKVHRGLPGRIRAAHHVHDLALAGQRLRRAAAVVNAGALQAVDSRSFQSPPLHARRDHQRVAGNLAAVRQLDNPVRPFDAHADRLLRRQDFHPETLRLHHRAARQVVAAETVRESQVVFDARTHSRLPARRFALDHHRVQSFRRAINGGRQSGRPSTHDRQIVEVGLRPRPQPDPSARPPPARCPAAWSRRETAPPADWQRLRPSASSSRLVSGSLAESFDVNPLVRDMIARQEIPQLVGARRPPRAQHPDSLERRAIGSLPVVEQVIQLRIEVLRRRVPRLHEKVIDVGFVDGADRSIGIGVRGQQRALGVGKNPRCFLQKSDAVHVRHALVRQQQGHAVIAHLQLLQKVQRALGRIASPSPGIRRRTATADRVQSTATRRRRHRHSAELVLPRLGALGVCVSGLSVLSLPNI